MRKLGIKPGHRVLLLAAPGGFEDGTLGELPEGVRMARRAHGKAHAIVSFHTARALASGSMAGVGDTEAVLERLDRVMAARAPELGGSLRPPVDPRDLEQLRRTVDPFEVPADVETLLRWADGQRSGPLLPALATSGPLLSATASAEHYGFLRDNVEDWAVECTVAAHRPRGGGARPASR